MEKLDECPWCQRRLGPVEYGGQICDRCSWSSEKSIASPDDDQARALMRDYASLTPEGRALLVRVARALARSDQLARLARALARSDPSTPSTPATKT